MPDQGRSRRQQAARPPARPLRPGPPGGRLGPDRHRRGRRPRQRAVRGHGRARPRPTSSARPACRRCPTRIATAACRSTDLEPDVWRGELSFGDSLCLVSANVVARLGTDELKDALVTLHPQSAIEHLHARFVAADGKGSDGAIALEATEVGATHKSRTLVPVRPAEPLAGAARSLADPARGPGRRRRRRDRRRRGPGARTPPGAAWSARSGACSTSCPRRTPAARKVTAATDRREEIQRRAAVAAARVRRRRRARSSPASRRSAGSAGPGRDRSRSMPARSAFDDARRRLAAVSGPGRRPHHRRPAPRAGAAQRRVRAARRRRGGGRPGSADRPAARGRRWPASTGCTASCPVASSPLFTFPPDEAADDLRRRSCAARTARRTCSTPANKTV